MRSLSVGESGYSFYTCSKSQSKQNQDFLVPLVEFQNVKCSVTAAKNVLQCISKEIGFPSYVKTEKADTESFHAHGQQACKFIRTKESVYIGTEFNFQRIGLRHQNGPAAVKSCENTLYITGPHHQSNMMLKSKLKYMRE